MHHPMYPNPKPTASFATPGLTIGATLGLSVLLDQFLLVVMGTGVLCHVWGVPPSPTSGSATSVGSRPSGVPHPMGSVPVTPSPAAQGWGEGISVQLLPRAARLGEEGQR